MKKLLALLMAVSLVLSLAACQSKKQAEDQPQSDVSSTETVAFTIPENYASVLLVTINPEFKLYLDEQGAVLAVVPINDDAKSITSDIESLTGDLETVIHSIVEAADKGGFVKENATVDFQITVIKDETVNVDGILNTAKESANRVFADSQKTVEITASVAQDALKTAEESQAESSSAAANSTVGQTSAHQSSRPQAQQQHQHSYSSATCTEPGKCSCGATTGSALGHNYSNGICTVCGVKDPNFVSYTSVKSKVGGWHTKFLKDNTLFCVEVVLNNSLGMKVEHSQGDLVDNLPADMRDYIINEAQDYCASFEGKLYYMAMGDGSDVVSVEEDGTTVTATGINGDKLVLTRTGENTLSVASADASIGYLESIGGIPRGTQLTFKAN